MNNEHDFMGMRIVPHSDESEKAVLGSVLINPKSFEKVTHLIDEDFYVPRNKRLFREIKEMYDKGNPIDTLTLIEKLKTDDKLEQIGGTPYFAELVNSVPSAANIEYYGKIVKEHSVRRTIVDAGERIQKIGMNEELKNIENVVNEADKEMFSILNNSKTYEYAPISDGLVTALKRFEMLKENKGLLRGIPTGYKGLDNLLSGLQRSDLIILAARPAQGKTALALDIMRQSAVRHKTKVGMFSLEMSDQQLIDRLLSQEARIDSWKLRTGQVKDTEAQERLKTASETLKNAHIYIDNTTTNTIASIRQTARKMKKDIGVNLIIIDYLQLIVPSQSSSSQSMNHQVSEVSKALKQLAIELDIPILALSQLSRKIEDRGVKGVPRLSDLRDSGSIEQDADVVMFIHQKNKAGDDPELESVDILVEKHRNGPIGRVPLTFQRNIVSFHEYIKN